MKKEQLVQVFAYSLTAITLALAVMVWGHSLSWHIFGTSTLLLFPIFGLAAFSILWSQYITLAARYYLKVKSDVLKTYYNVTGWLVLLFILLHPGLLIWQLWRNGDGLPPHSELNYVMPSLKWVVILGMINLTILLLFELRRVFANRSWWRYFMYLVDLVVLLVFYHGLRLGTQLQAGWYRYVWLFYGLSYVICLGYIYFCRYQLKQDKTKKI